LIIVGSGIGQSDSVETELRNMAKKKKRVGKSVYFLGNKKREEIAELLKVADIFIYPSIHPEGTALSVLEAMATGLPVAVSDVGGLTDVVDNGIDGVIFPSRNTEAIEQSLTRLVGDLKLRKKMGEMGRKKVVKNYSNKQIAQKYIKVLLD
jgi:glycosyltransferase involved in cell wall biosynthesis